MAWRGRVERKPFGGGSKSAHDAVVLVTDAGEYVLRRAGGNPFVDPALDALVGTEVECEGALNGYTLIVTGWKAV